MATRKFKQQSLKEHRPLKEPRPLIELLKLLKEFILSDKCYNKGICYAIGSYNFNVTNDEKNILDDYIQKNKPSIYSKWFCWSRICSVYWWKPGDMVIRSKWLEYHIQKLNQNN